MALTKLDNVLWFDTNIYVKIPLIQVIETWKDDDWKLYSLECFVNYYTNNTKEYQFKQENELFKNLRLEDCNIANWYEEMKKLEKFIWFTDC